MSSSALDIQELAECLLGSLGTTGSIEDDDAIRLGHVRQRSDDAQLIVVCRLPVRHNIDSLAITLASFVQRAPMKLFGWNVVIHDDQQVMIAIPACAGARPRAEQDYLARVEVLDNRLQQVSRDFA